MPGPVDNNRSQGSRKGVCESRHGNAGRRQCSIAGRSSAEQDARIVDRRWQFRAIPRNNQSVARSILRFAMDSQSKAIGPEEPVTSFAILPGQTD